MDPSQIQPSSSGASPTPQNQKLKDSCDRCSVSKIRCTKEKPSCARCDKLGYACFYSPARRVGRPHRSKESSNKTGDADTQTRTIKPIKFIDEGDRLLSRLNGSSTHDTADVSNQRYTHSVQQDHVAENPHHPVDQDCTFVIVELFSELEIPASQLRYSSSVDSSLLNMTTQILTAVLNRLSSILICSCSAKGETAMLISAVCMTVIDIHGMILAKFHETLGNKAMAMPVIGELSKVASLVLQFIDRYNGELYPGDSSGQSALAGNAIPLDFLPALGNLMRERLQQITDDATCWLG
ncbi:hypothetical protein N7507_003089 [Penicillium longicatenatum]|nr:hypothetical protein N7507_003089 [Penicillium longicatenatum]